VELAPELVPLPPLICWSAVAMSWREFRFNSLVKIQPRARKSTSAANARSTASTYALSAHPMKVVLAEV
jgi:hypothetical protein